ncbi:MAG: cysteine desulfurase family protein [Pseudomonadota bacterium]
MMKIVECLNLDYNATAPLRSIARAEALQAMDMAKGNPSSVHSFGRNARSMLENARTRIAEALSIESKQIVFTSGATESNAMVIRGFKGPILVSAIEHSSLLEARDDVTLAPVDENGVVLVSFIEKWLQEHQGHSLVSVMAANNETGVVQPVDEIYALCKRTGASFHSDAVQAVGRIPLNLAHFDCISLSAHKLGGLSGVGCVIIKESFPLNALLRGGGQERSYRSGTENIVGICAFSAAVEEAMSIEELNNWRNVEELRIMLEAELMTVCDDVRIIGKNALRLANTTCITMPNLKAETQVMRFDLEGIAVSAGSACSSGKIKKSRVLAAMGVPESIAKTAIRVSLSPKTTKQDIKRFISIWNDIYRSINHNDDKKVNAA